MSELYTQFNDKTNSVLDFLITDNKLIKLVLALSLVLYGSLAAPSFPSKYMWVFENVGFRVVFLAFIAWTTTQDPMLGVFTAIMFLITIDLLLKQYNNKVNRENFEGPSSAVFPGCANMTIADLLESFGNDEQQLVNAMLQSKVPGDVTTTDYYAPIISTYLLNHGFALKKPCSFPEQSESIGY